MKKSLMAGLLVMVIFQGIAWWESGAMAQEQSGSRSAADDDPLFSSRKPGVTPSLGLPMEEGERPESRLSFYGYGELHYNHPEGSGLPSGDTAPTFDFHRLVLGWGYQFNDRLTLNVEVEWEHAGQEIELEYAYLDYIWSDAIGFRAGSLLMPVGLTNENHEPPLFFSVERPYVERYIIPTTWQEGGVGIFGQPLPGVNYRLYLVEGLNAVGVQPDGTRGDGGFTENGIRGGRQVLFEDTNVAKNFGGVGRLEYTGLPGFLAGASYYRSDAAQGFPDIGHATVSLWDVDARARFSGFVVRALYARSRISDADRISGVVGETVGSAQVGWYAEGGYHLNQLLRSEWDVVPFVRWEKIDTQAEIPDGFPRNPATDRKVLTAGLALYPVPNVALKADRERWEDDTDAEGVRYNFGMAFMF